MGRMLTTYFSKLNDQNERVLGKFLDARDLIVALEAR